MTGTACVTYGTQSINQARHPFIRKSFLSLKVLDFRPLLRVIAITRCSMIFSCTYCLLFWHIMAVCNFTLLSEWQRDQSSRPDWQSFRLDASNNIVFDYLIDTDVHCSFSHRLHVQHLAGISCPSKILLTHHIEASLQLQ
jgi:hypothetical protein